MDSRNVNAQSRVPARETPEENYELDELAPQPHNSAESISSRKRFLVLLGCCLLQLPIWGFAMTYGIFQEYYLDNWIFDGSPGSVGLVGMISNGVMYLSMPFLFAALVRRCATYRRTAAVCGIFIASAGFLASSFSTHAWHLIVSQGCVVAFGSVLIYSPTTLALSEHFSSTNRALAYAAVLSSKSITGSTCPFLVQFMLERLGFRTTVRIWAGLVAATGLIALFVMPIDRPSHEVAVPYRSRKIPWSFLLHREIYLYSISIVLQSSGYGMAQSYLSSYAHSTASLSTTSSTLLLTLFNGPGILASPFFGFLSDNKEHPMTSGWTTLISALPSALAVFLLWGLAGATTNALSLLILFSVVYGFFASGYSATWGGVIKEMEMEAAARNEAFDSGMVYGMLNGARGIGYVGGGLLAVELLKAGSIGHDSHRTAYGTMYGPLIIYTGISTLCGGWTAIFKGRTLVKHVVRYIDSSWFPWTSP